MKIAPVLALPLALLAIGCSPDGLLSPLKGTTEYRLTIDTPVHLGPGAYCLDGQLPLCAAEEFFVEGSVSVERWVEIEGERRAVGTADLISSCYWPEPDCTSHHHLRADGEKFYPSWFADEEPLQLQFDDFLFLAGHEVAGGAIEGKLLRVHTRGPGGMSYLAAFRLEPAG